ncbi:flagellar filament capping protein FliD [Alkalihalobacterium bogoriense]|uniref:flagellar filament capping protein FliD n=1 Tax=Alkalihalobacterium bogoriense TaxID=246272 RepID=UPI000688CFF6|nr:flagellar filament capping protein FliD [Alkalihalobacterium bogoriense]
MRMSGLASGMDIESMVRDMMRVRRMPIDKMMQQKQVLQWQMDSYRDVNRNFSELRNNIVDNMLLTRSNLQAKTAVSSNDSRITATAAPSAGNVSYQITEVSKLARAASTSSSSEITTGAKVDTTRSLMSQSDKFASGIDWKNGVIERQSFRATAGQVNFQLDSQKAQNIKQDYTNDMIVKVDGKVFNVVDVTEQAGRVIGENEVGIDYSTGTLRFGQGQRANADIQVTYFRENNLQTLPASSSSPQQNFQLAHGSIDLQSLTITANGKEFTANGEFKIVTSLTELNENTVFVNVETGAVSFSSAQTQPVTANYQQKFVTAGVTTHTANGPVQDKFVFDGRTSLSTVMSTMNNSSVGISMFYDEHTDSVAANRKSQGVFNNTGDRTEMSFEGSFFTQTLGLDSRGSQGAQNATFIINGLETERTSNTFTLSGVTFTLREEFLAANNPSPVTISVNTNTDKVMETITDFVNKYNELIEKTNGLLREDRHRSFQPLTDEQKEAMSEKEIEKWEERARSGLLRNDTLIAGSMDRLRSAVNSPVSSPTGSFTHLSQIGITTSPDYMAGGKLIINEEKLRKAIEDDVEGVFNIFTANGDGFGGQGIVRRMRDTLDASVNSIAQRAGGSRGLAANHQFTIGRNINNLDSRIDNLERRMKQVEDRYWKQFSAMESAMMRSNQQADMIFAQLFGNQG